jgi:hypothetical protein
LSKIQAKIYNQQLGLTKKTAAVPTFRVGTSGFCFLLLLSFFRAHRQIFRNALDVRADTTQFFDDSFVTAINMINAVNQSFASRRERG